MDCGLPCSSWTDADAPASYTGCMRKLSIDNSSNVKSITFDDGHLDVEFSSGDIYRYTGCTLDDYREVSGAESVGQWVQRTLVRQPDKHPFTKLSSATVARASVSGEVHALRTIASLRFPKGVDHAIVEVARTALEGKLPPPPPKEWDLPTVVRGTTDVHGIEWPSILGERVLSLDEADAVSYAIAGASLSARDA